MGSAATVCIVPALTRPLAPSDTACRYSTRNTDPHGYRTGQIIQMRFREELGDDCEQCAVRIQIYGRGGVRVTGRV